MLWPFIQKPQLIIFPSCVIDPKLEEGHSVTQAARSPLWSRDPRILFPVRATNPPDGKYLKNSKLWSYFQLGSFPMDCQYLLLASAAVFALSQYYLTAMSLLILNHQSQYSRMKSPTFETFTPCTKAISSTISKLIPLCICKSPLLPSRIWAKHFQAENKAFSGNVFFDIFETLWHCC